MIARDLRGRVMGPVIVPRTGHFFCGGEGTVLVSLEQLPLVLWGFLVL